MSGRCTSIQMLRQNESLVMRVLHCNETFPGRGLGNFLLQKEGISGDPDDHLL
jgi:hypothetical protein